MTFLCYDDYKFYRKMFHVMIQLGWASNLGSEKVSKNNFLPGKYVLNVHRNTVRIAPPHIFTLWYIWVRQKKVKKRKVPKKHFSAWKSVSKLYRNSIGIIPNTIYTRYHEFGFDRKILRKILVIFSRLQIFWRSFRFLSHKNLIFVPLKIFFMN